MMQTLTIARRELSALFFSPIAYVVLGLFASISAIFFLLVFFNPGDQATLEPLFGWVVFVLLMFMTPAISMRLVSEEFGRGTIETLMTSPVTDTQVVLGKFAGAGAFMVAMLLTLAIPVIALECVASPDYGPILSGFLGLVLVGGLFLAIGLFASCLTGNQIIAFVLGLFMLLPLVLPTLLAQLISRMAVRDSIRRLILYLGVHAHFEGFTRGVFTVANLIYFLTGICLFLFLAIKVIESRRWR